jgi:hypothetical protein
MALDLTRQQAKVLVSFRRSTVAKELYEIAVGVLDARRAAYEETHPASEELRHAVNDAKSTLGVLFEDEIAIKE